MYRLCSRKASSSSVESAGHPDVGVDSTCSSVLTVDTAGVVVIAAVDGELVGTAVGDDVVGDDVGAVVGDDVVGEAVGALDGDDVVGESVGDEVVGLFVGGSGVVVVVVGPRGGHHSQIMRYVL